MDIRYRRQLVYLNSLLFLYKRNNYLPDFITNNDHKKWWNLDSIIYVCSNKRCPIGLFTIPKRFKYIKVAIIAYNILNTPISRDQKYQF